MTNPDSRHSSPKCEVTRRKPLQEEGTLVADGILTSVSPELKSQSKPWRNPHVES